MRRYYFILVFLLSAAGCRKPYNPPVIASASSYLVVEGVIDAGADSTIIKLSHAVKLSNATSLNPLSGAAVSVLSDQNAAYPLTELKRGSYVAVGLNLDNTHKYCLKITTPDGKTYQSDLVAVLNAPPIDSVGFNVQQNDSTHGMEIYLNSHDPTNTIRNFRYDYQETWIFHPKYQSYYKSNGDTVLERNYVDDDIYTCWHSDTSSTITLGSSARLSNAVISKQPITFVAYNSPKIAVEYSIIVRQYALTSEAFTFWTNLKKNTEQLGSIFDAEPTQIIGNIHCTTNPAEIVIGYISVGAVTQKRIFLAMRDLPAWPPTSEPVPSDCDLIPCLYNYVPPNGGSPINQVNELINYHYGAGANALIPVNAIAPPGGPVIGYNAAYPICVDCTLRGSNKQPSFWVVK